MSEVSSEVDTSRDERSSPQSSAAAQRRQGRRALGAPRCDARVLRFRQLAPVALRSLREARLEVREGAHGVRLNPGPAAGML